MVLHLGIKRNHEECIMKRRAAVLLAGTLAVSVLLAGCSGNNAADEYVSVGGYKEVEVEDIEEPEETTDEDVNNYIEAVLTQYATQEEIKDREAKSGDTVNIDFVGKMDGEAFDGGSSRGFNLQLGSGSFIPGFEDSIIGHMPGDTFDWNGNFPDPYDNNPDFAGKEVVFTITVNYICGESKLPELTDEFVQTVSEKSKTVEEYKEEIKKQLAENGTTDFDVKLQESAWQAVLEKAEIKEYPEDEKKKMKTQIMNAYESAAKDAELELADFLQQYYGISEEDFNKQVDETIESSLKEKLVAQAIAKQEKLIPNEEEMKKELETLAKDSGYESLEALKSAMGENADEEALKDIVILKRVKEYFAEHAEQVKE